jgi:hypothetical protein
MPQISAQQHQEGRIVEEYGALPRALAAHRQVLVVGGQVQILDVGAERFAGPQARGMDQPEQHPIAQIRDNAHWSKKPSLSGILKRGRAHLVRGRLPVRAAAIGSS